jgi:ABC-type lipoprotein release transport system permease subunit
LHARAADHALKDRRSPHVSPRAARLTTLLYGFRLDYTSTVAAVSLILAAAATPGCFVPARRAALIDPMIALRQE